MIKLIANYSKRLGLPGYSSHQFSVSCETEITNVSDVAAESARLYETLQQSVDEQIQSTGFVPDTDYGSNGNGSIKPVNRIANASKTNGLTTNGADKGWRCSDKQRELVLKLIADHNIETAVGEMSMQMFGKSPENCNRLECSGLIARILDEYASKKPSKSKNGNGRYVAGGAH
jgi:hypothetical protein